MTETEATKRAIVAERLKEARKLAGISQGHVAKILGLHRPSISGMESGKRRVSAYELARLAEIYDVGVPWLLGEAPETLDPQDPRLELAARELTKAQARRPQPPAEAARRYAQRLHPGRGGRR